VCDLAEWGVVVDDADSTKRIMDAFWNPMWAVSFCPEDCDVEAVMDGLTTDRDGENPNRLSPETKKLLEERTKEQPDLLRVGRAGSIAIQQNTATYFMSDDVDEEKKCEDPDEGGAQSADKGDSEMVVIETKH